MTSSKIKIDPSDKVSSRSAFKNSMVGGTQPMFPTTGSKITAAICPECCANAFLTAETSLYSRTIVSCPAPGVTPGESGTPSVAAALPAATNNASTCPW